MLPGEPSVRFDPLDKIRLGVGNKPTRRSSLWVIVCNKNDVYVGVHGLAGKIGRHLTIRCLDDGVQGDVFHAWSDPTGRTQERVTRKPLMSCRKPAPRSLWRDISVYRIPCHGIVAFGASLIRLTASLPCPRAATVWTEAVIDRRIREISQYC